MTADPLIMLTCLALASFIGSVIVLRSRWGRDPLLAGSIEPQHVHAKRVPRASGAALGDGPITAVATIGAGVALGFFIFNYSRGLIFLGDCGAYFLGFLVAAVAVLIVQRHAELSAWIP